MGLHNLLTLLKRDTWDTPDTHRKPAGYQRKHSAHAACTRDTPETSGIDFTKESAPNGDVSLWREPIASGTSPVALARMPYEPANDAPSDQDRYCWPHSEAMNGKEIYTFTARLVHFTAKGLSLETAEWQADRLTARDREDDDRRLCLECPHLQGLGRWRCGNWEAADMAREGMAPDLVQTLQRCSGYPNAAYTGL